MPTYNGPVRPVHPDVLAHFDILLHGANSMIADNASKIRHLTNAKATYMQLKHPSPGVIKAFDNEIAKLEKANDLPPKREQDPQLQAIPPSDQADQSR